MSFDASIEMAVATAARSLLEKSRLGARFRPHVRVICSGKVVTGFDLAHKIAIGADLCNSARAMMFALGCIQAQKCNTNECPAGVATQYPWLVAGPVVARQSRARAQLPTQSP
ncbi:MAG: glutamate synthase-related protein [Polyangiaceae bacterium]